MAKDKVKLYSVNIINKRYINLNGWQYINQHRYWQYTTGPYYLKFALIQGSTNTGYLIIDFSVSKVLNGNNAIPSTQMNIPKLVNQLHSDLKGILNLDTPNLMQLKVARDETFVDIIASKEIIESIKHVIEYSKISKRKVDTTYKEKGSLYIHSGSKREKASHTLIAYDKGRECASRGCNIHNIKDLKEGQMCLRLEVKNKGYSLKKLAKHFKHSSSLKKSLNNIKLNNIKLNKILKEPLNSIKLTKINVNLSSNFYEYIDYLEISQNILESINFISTDNLIDLKTNSILPNYNTYLEFISTLSTLHDLDGKFNFVDILNPSFESNLIKGFLQDLHLFDSNIKILTKKQLFKFIKESNVFKSDKTKDTAKKVIKFLNGEISNSPCCSKYLSKYRKDFLNAGVHFLYVKHPIPKLSQDALNSIYETGNLVIE